MKVHSKLQKRKASNFMWEFYKMSELKQRLKCYISGRNIQSKPEKNEKNNSENPIVSTPHKEFP